MNGAACSRTYLNYDAALMRRSTMAGCGKEKDADSTTISERFGGTSELVLSRS
jgi:hypothetical protein